MSLNKAVAELRKMRDGDTTEPIKTAIPTVEVNGHRIRLGSFKITEIYQGLGISLSLYALQQMLTAKGKVNFLVGFSDFSAPPQQRMIKTDLNKSEPVFVDYFTIYNDVLLTVQINQGVLAVSAYADNEEAAKTFFSDLTKQIRYNNFYRGKCLYFTGSEIEFKATPDITWDDVVVDEDLKNEMRLNVTQFFANEEFRKMKINKRGIILWGPPGTGKTSVVRAIFAELANTKITRLYLTNETFNRMDMSEFFSTIHHLLPAILVFEDIDLIGGDRGTARSRVIGALLTHLDGVDKLEEPMVVIGTTNDLDALDDALRNRPARFDRIIEVPAPKPEAAALLYKKLTGLDVPKRLIDMSDGFTGAHIEEAVKTAYMLSMDGGKKKIEVLPNELLKNLVTAIKYIIKSFPLKKKAPDGSGFGIRSKKSEAEADADLDSLFDDPSPFENEEVKKAFEEQLPAPNSDN